jgi:cell division septation protein DedD
MTNSPVPPDRPHIYAFSVKRLVLLASLVVLVIALGLMLGIRIEKYQQTQTAGLRAAPAPKAAVTKAGSETKEKSRDAAPPKVEPTKTKAASKAPAPVKASSKKAVPKTAKPAPKPVAPAPVKAVTAKPAAPKTEVAPRRARYTVQVESSQDRGKATIQVETLKNNGFSAFLEQADLGDKGRYYRVMVGPYQTKAQAKEAQSALARDSRFTDSLIRYIP